MPQPTKSPSDLPKQWRTEADFFERHGATAHAATKRADAEDLESAIRAAEDALLTREQAAEFAGCAPDTITRLVRRGHLHNYGKAGSPLVRAGDLPRKVGRTAPASLTLEADPEQVDPGIVRIAVAAKRNSQRRRAGT